MRLVQQPDDIDPEKLLHLHFEEANKEWPWIRITSINGVPLIVTRDYRVDRLNVELVDNKVVKAYWG